MSSYWPKTDHPLIIINSLIDLPTTVTLILRVHIWLTVFNSQLNTPSSIMDTLKITRVAVLWLWAIQLKLNLDVKAETTEATFIPGTMVATMTVLNFNVSVARLSCVRLNVQFSLSLVNPSRSCALWVRTTELSVTIPTGGGSFQVTLAPASETVNLTSF